MEGRFRPLIRQKILDAEAAALPVLAPREIGGNWGQTPVSLMHSFENQARRH